LLARLLDIDYDGDEHSFTPEQRNGIHLLDADRLVLSKLLYINYTTYDVRRDHDTVRAARRDTVMTFSRDDEHPFWYAQVIMAFHIMVGFYPEGSGQTEKKMEVLWIRWLGVDQDHKWGFKEGRLPKVGFVPDHPDHVPFGFLDPSLVLRACHLIPAYSDGRTHELLAPGPSIARLSGEEDDWAAYYVNM
jgi:hypothetical protein